MSKFDFRILLETVEGQKTSYTSQSFVDTSQALVLSASQVFHRITGSVSCSYQNQIFFSGSSPDYIHPTDINSSSFFKDNTLLSASLLGDLSTGSVVLTATDTEYDRLLRYKFFGEKVCNVLGLPHAQWVYVDQFSLQPDTDNNFFQGNINAENLFIGDSLTFENDATINSDVPFLIDTGSDRHIKFIDERGAGSRALIIGYDKDADIYEISGSEDENFHIGGLDKIVFSDGTSQTTAGGGSGTITGLNNQAENRLVTIGATTTELDGEANLTFNGSELVVIGDVSASGTITSSGLHTTGVISASGTGIHRFADDVMFDENQGIKFVDSNTGIIGTGDSITLDGDNTVNIQADTVINLKNASGAPSEGINIVGDVTASNNISASGTLISNEINTIGNITASGNISASGDVIARSGSFDVISKVGDSNTRILFTDDDINIMVGGMNMVDFTEGSTDEITFNETAQQLDVRIESESDPNLFFTDGNQNKVGIGTNTPGEKLEVVGNISASGAITSSGLHTTGIISASSTTSNRFGGDLLVDDDKGIRFGDVGQGILGSAASNSITIDGNDTVNIQADTLVDIKGGLTDGVNIDADITASSNISASGTITANSFVGTLTGTATGLSGTPDIAVGAIEATSINTTNITSSIITSSIIQTSGSNIFGDEASDTHQFIGSITASADISASGTVFTNEIDAPSGDLTIDSAGDIILDADGTDIILKDNGTSFGSFKRASSDFIIKAETADKDILFKGTDVSSTITALTLDMSDAGSATFNNHITTSGEISSSDRVIAKRFNADGTLEGDGGYAFRLRDDTGMYEEGFNVGVLAPENVQIAIDSNNNNNDISDPAQFVIVHNNAVLDSSPASPLFQVFEDGRTLFSTASVAGVTINHSTGHITASGAITSSGLHTTGVISASGTGIHTFADDIIFDENQGIKFVDANTGIIGNGDLITIDGDNTVNIQADTVINLKNASGAPSEGINIVGDVTASGNISSSGGDIFADEIFSKGDAYQIHIDGNDGSGPQVLFGTHNDSDNFMRFGAFGGRNAIDTKARDFHLFGTNTTTGFLFDEGLGNFGIKTLVPSASLDVNGNLQVQSHITASGDISASATSTGSFGYGVFSTSVLVGQTSHNGYGTVNANTNDLIVNGQFSAAGSAGSAIYKLQIGDNLGLPADEGDLNVGNDLTIGGDITASANISASGDLFVDDITATNIDILDSDAGNNPRLRVGRQDGQHIEINVDDNDNTIKAEQDSDSDGDHKFILTREFDGAGASDFIIRSGSTDQLTIDKNNSSNFSGNITSSGLHTTGVISSSTTDSNRFGGDILVDDDKGIRFGDTAQGILGSAASNSITIDGNDTINIQADTVINLKNASGGPSAGVNIVGSVTASGDISSSIASTGSFGHLMVGGGNFTSASLAADNGAVSAVANGSNNRIATFSSADALNGEANLTFDGSTLGVTGDINTTSHITASGNISSSGGESTFGQVVNLIGTDPRLRLKAIGANHPGIEWHEDSTRKWVLYNDPDESDKLVFKNDSTELVKIDQAGGTEFPSHITASGDISASGTQHIFGGSVGIGTSSPAVNLHVSDTAGSNTLETIRIENSNGYGELGVQSTYVRLLADGNLTYAANNSQTLLSVGGATKATLNSSGLNVDGHITASGDISASGVITSNGGVMSDNLTFATGKGVRFVDAGQGIIGDSTSITIDGDDTVNIQADTLVDIKGGLTEGVNIDGNITASANISASGDIFGYSASFDSRVGIGVTDPDAKLEIVSDGDSSATKALEIKDSGGQNLFYVRNDGVTSVTHGYLFVQASAGAFITGKTNARGGVTDDQGALGLGSSGDVDDMVISSSNVGIGTTTPDEKLEVVGNISASGAITSSGLHTTGVISSSATDSNRFGGDLLVDDDNGMRFGDSGQAILGSAASNSITIDGNDTVNIQADTVINLKNASGGPSDGVNIVGSVTASNNISSSGDIIGTTGSFGEINLGDDKEIRLGDGGDLRIFHDPHNSVIREDGGGDLFLQGSAIRIRENSDGGTIALFTDGAGTELRHDNVTKFETNDNGINITGEISASGNISSSGAITSSGLHTTGVISASSTTSNRFGGDLLVDDDKGVRFGDAGQGILGSAASNSITIDGNDTVNIQADVLVDIKGGLTKGVNIDGNITASNNISSSITSTGSFGLLQVEGANFTSASLAAGGGAVSAVANGSNNRIATFSSGDALNGEVNLTFDGSDLTLVGAASASGAITSSGLYVEGEISGSSTSTFRIGGKLIAGSKSFVIPRPEGGSLEYGVLEGQQNDVFFRGELKGDNVIYLPKEWEWLVDDNTITVQLTSIGKHQELFVKEIKDNKIFIDINGMCKGKNDIHCYHIIHGTRKDIELIRNYQ